MIILAHRRSHSFNKPAQLSSWTIRLKLGLSHYLHRFYIFANSVGSGETAHPRSLALAFAVCTCVVRIYNLDLGLASSFEEERRLRSATIQEMPQY